MYNFRRNTASVSHTKKASLEHEEAFDKVREQSIPSAVINNYIPEILSSRLNGIVSIAYNNPENIVGWDHPYLVQLKHDIKRYQYKLNFQQWLIVHVHIKKILKICAFMIIAKNFILYRLRINN